MSQSSASINGGDIHTRYERLAAEFAKVRSHASVLKKGVLEERAKADALAEQLRAAEGTIRRVSSENDSLLFRNEQLLKRTHTLQDELESQKADAKKSKSSKKSGNEPRDVATLQTALAVLQEELDSKLRANERLTVQLEESERERSVLTEHLKRAEQEVKEMSTASMHGRSLMQPPSTPNSNYANSFQTSPTVMPKSASTTSTVSSLLSSSSTVPLQTTSSSTPTVSSSCSSLTLAAHTPQWQATQSGVKVIGDVTTLLSLVAQRTRLFPFDASLEPLPPAVQQLAEALEACSRGFNDTSESVSGVAVAAMEEEDSEEISLSTLPHTLALLIQACSLSLSSLPTGLAAVAHAESSANWADAALETLNDRWRAKLIGLLEALHSCTKVMQECYDAFSSPHSDLPSSATLKRVAASVSALHAAAKGTQEAFSARWLVETRLPVQTKKGKCVGSTTRDCLLRMVADVAAVSAALSTAITHAEAHEREVRKRERTPTRMSSSSPSASRTPTLTAAARGMSNGERSSHVLIPSSSSTNPFDEEEAEDDETDEQQLRSEEENGLCMQEGVDEEATKREESAETNKLIKEMEFLRDSLRQAESEKEKLLLDVTLLKKKVGNLTGSAVVHEEAASSTAPVDDDALLQRDVHYEARLREVADKLLKARSRGDYYARECEALLRTTKHAIAERQKKEEEARELDRKRAALDDELNITRRGFETQLREMSEHVASMQAAREAKDKDAGLRGSLRRGLTFK